MFRPLSLFAAALAVAASVLPVQAQSGQLQVGVLECHATGTTTFVVGSTARLNCVFHPTPGTGPDQSYVATVRRMGLDIGVTERSVISWLVLAPSRGGGPYDLAGNYAGVSAGATVGLGVAANALVGGSNSSIALQPLSVQGQTGLNVAAGIAHLELRPGD